MTIIVHDIKITALCAKQTKMAFRGDICAIWGLKWQLTLSLSRSFPRQVLFGRPKQVIFWCRKLPSLTICYHHWGHALMDWDIATSKPPFLWLFHLFHRSFTPFMSWVITHHIKLVFIVSVCPFPGRKGKRAEPPKVGMGQKQEGSALSYHLVLDLCRFL